MLETEPREKIEKVLRPPGREIPGETERKSLKKNYIRESEERCQSGTAKH